MFYNAQCLISGKPAPTKRSVRDALKDRPESVFFRGTAAGFQGTDGYRANELAEDINVVLVGPSSVNRQWYAQVNRRTDGTFVVI